MESPSYCFNDYYVTIEGIKTTPPKKTQTRPVLKMYAAWLTPYNIWTIITYTIISVENTTKLPY